MVTLTADQAQAIKAFMECFDLHTTSVWPVLEKAMIDEFGIDDPETILEEVREALQ